jgi:prophage regulatory protein
MATNPTATHQARELKRLLRLPEVAHYTGLRRSQIYRLAADGEFPKPCKIGSRASAWIESEVIDWVEARIAQRETA